MSWLGCIASVSWAQQTPDFLAVRVRPSPLLFGDCVAYVRLREGEDAEGLLKRFQTSMQRSGILRDLRNRRFFRSKGEQSRLDHQRSLRRLRRRKLRK